MHWFKHIQMIDDAQNSQQIETNMVRFPSLVGTNFWKPLSEDPQNRHTTRQYCAKSRDGRFVAGTFIAVQIDSRNSSFNSASVSNLRARTIGQEDDKIWLWGFDNKDI